MPDFKKQKLSDCIDYVNEKINIEELNDLNYISTENMLPNRGGITKSSGLPNANYTQCFSEGDILLSNIRPYFKKIWYATFNGGCSNDVLVLRAKSNMYSKFLYYVLSDDKFFEYDTATSKGTKMPRGDKVAIMKYGVPQYDLPKQKKIARVLSSLDDKIELNNKINQNLEQQAQAIFKSWFVNFEPFGGKMPDDWKKSNLLEIANYLNGLAMQKYRPKDNEPCLPVLKIKELRQGFCDNSSDVCTGNINNAYIINNGDIIFSWSGSLLVDIWCGGKCGLNQHLFKVTSEKYDKWFYYFWTKHYLSKFIALASDMATTMGHIKREELEKSEVIIPNKEEYQKINSIISPILNLIINNKIQNKQLAQLRDTLLPKLMNGEIDVDKIWNSTTALRQSILA